MEQEIKNLLYELGILVFSKKTQTSPNYIIYHYDLADVKQMPLLDKKVKILASLMHLNVLLKPSSIAHFAISVPKKTRSVVRLEDKKYQKIFDGTFTIFAGIDECNNPVVLNIDELPHILVAGTTGSGKSVMVNSIICSLLKQKNYKVEFNMIDTKRVELSPYKKLGDDWCVVSTEANIAIENLKNICDDLDSRYLIMEQNGWRKIPDTYYKKIVVIEELGDLMIVSKGIVEKYIVKIAQLGRACGIHLVVATQRPTVDVVTGAIKANIGCRFALQTTSAIDSRNILGHNGAEKLEGQGDCLLKLPNNSEEIHIQCPLVSDDDIQKIIEEF